MKILYSKPSVKKMLKMPEKQVAKILTTVKEAMNRAPGVRVQTLSGYKDKREVIQCPPLFIVAVQKQFKGVQVYYVMDVLDKEDMEYYTGA